MGKRKLKSTIILRAMRNAICRAVIIYFFMPELKEAYVEPLVSKNTYILRNHLYVHSNSSQKVILDSIYYYYYFENKLSGKTCLKFKALKLLPESAHLSKTVSLKLLFGFT